MLVRVQDICGKQISTRDESHVEKGQVTALGCRDSGDEGAGLLLLPVTGKTSPPAVTKQRMGYLQTYTEAKRWCFISGDGVTPDDELASGSNVQRRPSAAPDGVRLRQRLASLLVTPD